MKDLVPVIGIEVHVEPKTKSKMFCGCSAEHFGVAPNTHVCPVCLGMPGALPVPNKTALEKLVALGKALGCRVNQNSYFERKSYFYPDLPKGYQISQYRGPLCIQGRLPLPSGKVVRVNRAHMEEDTAKMKHREGGSFIDFNRSGVPLIEIVSEADIASAAEAKEYLKQLARLVRWLSISDASMEKGTMRLEANVSIQSRNRFKVGGSTVKALENYKLNPRVELKNINSYRFVEKAINYEIKRQTKIINSGKKLRQETRGWDETKQKTYIQRTKETSSDYRYFPEPDIPPLENCKWQVMAESEPLPWEADKVLEKKYKLPCQYISVIGESLESYLFFERCVDTSRGKVSPKLIAGEIVNKKLSFQRKTPESLVARLLRPGSGRLSSKELKRVVAQVVAANPKAVGDYRGGKEASLHYLLGQIMKESKGKADAADARKYLKEAL